MLPARTLASALLSSVSLLGCKLPGRGCGDLSAVISGIWQVRILYAEPKGRWRATMLHAFGGRTSP